MEPSLLFLQTGQSPTASTRGRKSLALPFFSNILPFSGMQVLLPRLLPVCPLLVFATEIHQQSQALASPNKRSIMTSSISPEGYAAMLKVYSFFPHYLVQINWSLSPPPAEKTFLVLRSDDLSNQGQRGEERLLPPLYDPLFQYHRPEKIQFSPSWTTIFSVFSYLHSYHWAKIWTRSLLHSWGRTPAWPTLPSRPTAAPHTAEAEIKPLPQRFAQPQLFRDFALKVTSNLADVGSFAAAYPIHFSTETHDGEAGGLTLRVIRAPLA